MSSAVARYTKKAIKSYPAVRKRYNVYVPAVKQLASDVMYLKGLINSEPKFHNAVYSGNLDYNGAILSLSAIPAGTSDQQRLGERILPRWITIRMFHGMGVSTTVPNLIARVILFRWWGNNAGVTTAPTVSEIITYSGSTTAPFGFLDEEIVGSKGDRNRRIEVLRNHVVTFNNKNNYSESFEYNIDLNPKQQQTKEHMEFDSATTANPISGGVYMLIITDNATNTEYGYKMISKLKFYDN